MSKVSDLERRVQGFRPMSLRHFVDASLSSTPIIGIANSRRTSRPESSIRWPNVRAKRTPPANPRNFESLRFTGFLGLLSGLAG
jgi:hypothetical protein